MTRLLNRVIEYFDLQSDRRGLTRGLATGTDSSQNLAVIPQYLALVSGIVVQPYLSAYQASGVWIVNFDPFISRIIFAALVGLVVFPGVYKSAFDKSQPKFVQFCSIFALGIGWKALFDSAVKATVA